MLAMSSLKRTSIPCLVMLSTVILLGHFRHIENRHLKKPLTDFPKQISEWAGREEHFAKEVYNFLGVDDSFLCNYRDMCGNTIQLYIGFYRSQMEGRIIHSPKNCMPGAGWNVIHSSLETIRISGGDGDDNHVIKLLLEKGSEKQVVLYWFQSRGRIVVSEYLEKVFLVIDAFKLRRTDGSFVRLISPVSNGNEHITTDYMKSFAQSIIPVLEDFLP